MLLVTPMLNPAARPLLEALLKLYPDVSGAFADLVEVAGITPLRAAAPLRTLTDSKPLSDRELIVRVLGRGRALPPSAIFEAAREISPAVKAASLRTRLNTMTARGDLEREPAPGGKGFLYRLGAAARKHLR